MDSIITAAARRLAEGDPVGALGFVALRNDPEALALRGIGLAQLGDLSRARALLREASEAFGASEPVARARCLMADAEVALAARDLSVSEGEIEAAVATLSSLGDSMNAAYGGLLLVRRCLLFGELDKASRRLAELDIGTLAPPGRATAYLLGARLAVRRVEVETAKAMLHQAEQAVHLSGVAALTAELEDAYAELERPAARRVRDGATELVVLSDVEAILRGPALVVDGCRRVLRRGDETVSLVRRPVLFALLSELAIAGPIGCARESLIRAVFETTRPNDSHRARLRVDIGRLRKLIEGMARIEATSEGFALVVDPPPDVLLPPFDGADSSIFALLADGQPWSSAALAEALGLSQRTVQRALASLEADDRVTGQGRGAARRWLCTLPFPVTTALLLPLVPSGR
ncbi:MAG: HTH domain-containing protein [Myxococcota bacterium]